MLTKALGTGIVANALRNDAVGDDVLAAAVASMTTLNRAGAIALRELGPHAVTDVTGFGLLGHLREMCAASGVHARVVSTDLPLLARRARTWRARASSPAARSATARRPTRTPTSSSGVDPVLALLACDAQTSGGLLAAVPPDERAGRPAG